MFRDDRGSSKRRVVRPLSLLRLLLAILLAGAAAACESGTPRDDRPVAQIAPALRFVTPPPAALGYAIEVHQFITARYGRAANGFEGLLSVAPDKLQLVGLDGFGRRAMTIARSGDVVAFEREPWFPADLEAANILADIAIIYWPEEAVRQGLSGTRAVVETTAAERRITLDGEEIVHVAYDAGSQHPWDGPVHYRNAAFGYELALRSVVLQR
jgi:hypothetical protein